MYFHISISIPGPIFYIWTDGRAAATLLQDYNLPPYFIFVYQVYRYGIGIIYPNITNERAKKNTSEVRVAPAILMSFFVRDRPTRTSHLVTGQLGSSAQY